MAQRIARYLATAADAYLVWVPLLQTRGLAGQIRAFPSHPYQRAPTGGRPQAFRDLISGRNHYTVDDTHDARVAL